jgi:excisionase family DNA binding protein
VTDDPGVPPLADQLLASWERFVLLLESSEHRALIGTAEAVDALLARSTVERLLEGGVTVDPRRLRALDERYRRLADVLLDRTRVHLYRDGHPDEDWWWRLDELAPKAPDAPLVDVAAIAAHKRVHPNTVRAAIHSGELPARRLGRGFLVDSRDVERWVPRPRGRPAKQSFAADDLLAAFNAANSEGDIARAHEITERLVREPVTARRCLAIAIDMYNHGEHGDSLVWLARAETLGLDRDAAAKATMVRGLALVQLGRSEEAAAELSQVDPPAGLRWNVKAALAEAWLAAGQPAKAEAVVRRAIEEEPGVAELRYLTARIQFHDGRPAEALQHIVAFRNAQPDDDAGLLLHGSILGVLGDVSGEDASYVEAKRLLERARPGAPDPARVLLSLAAARLGHWEESLRYAAAARETMEPSVAEELVHAALLGAMRRTSLTDASAVAKYAEQHVRVTALTRAFVAFGLSREGRRGEALAVLSALADQPDTPAVDCLAGLAYLSLDEPNHALARFSRLTANSDSPAFAHVLLGVAALAAGDRDRAVSAVSRLRDEPTELGVLAELTSRLLEDAVRRPSWRSQPPDVSDTVASALRSSGLPGRSWDIEHRSVSKVTERAVAAPTH